MIFYPSPFHSERMGLGKLILLLRKSVMALTRDKKSHILEKLAGIVKDSASVVFVNFHGLSMKDTDAMRQVLADEGVSYYVARKTLIRKVLDDAGVLEQVPELEGELALAYAEDPTAPARGVYAFRKEHEDTVDILGGLFEGEVFTRERILEIATIPSLQTLRGMFVNVINSPIQGLAIALQQIAEKKEA